MLCYYRASEHGASTRFTPHRNKYFVPCFGSDAGRMKEKPIITISDRKAFQILDYEPRLQGVALLDDSKTPVNAESIVAGSILGQF